MRFRDVDCLRDRSCSGASRAPLHCQAGFTLIELLLAVVVAGLLAALAIPSYSSYLEGLKVDQAINDIRLVDLNIQRFYTVNFRYPTDLGELRDGFPTVDPWGNAYQYLNIALQKGKGKSRKDGKLNPINSDYDLYSVGKDGKSASPLTAKPSQDDIVRANNGGFIGLASKY
ncbi:MAG: prepilin-type N-terminal cleavage/methylation domain-containing protein [Gammaproteobacteria bacterium]|nr:prepilin-type N-terminal cleavage/methylation domain-containing protein [Gammaproteobacteria bacterium]MCP5424245.1 prepilin-type N-terminal cleavage/methylation domain-containing protein [Gammaproteobacteria bacterium]MCP5458881.1 prepilin-type N-terminal cleavage/methylation domain-containing protein [Gammaproteobacteria bacterium]